MKVFVDTAVIMYAAGREHRLRDPSRHLLRAVVQGHVLGVTSAEVIQEILHRFTGSGDPEVGAAMAHHALDVFAPILPVTHQVMSRMPDLTRQHPRLMARDLVHVATCHEERITTIVSPDSAFDGIDGLTRIDLADDIRLARMLGE